jgi:hypothetical protein
MPAEVPFRYFRLVHAKPVDRPGFGKSLKMAGRALDAPLFCMVIVAEVNRGCILQSKRNVSPVRLGKGN